MPRKLDSEKRERRVTVLFTEYEHARLLLLVRESSKLEPVTVSDYIRAKALDEGKNKR